MISPSSRRRRRVGWKQYGALPPISMPPTGRNLSRSTTPSMVVCQRLPPTRTFCVTRRRVPAAYFGGGGVGIIVGVRFGPGIAQRNSVAYGGDILGGRQRDGKSLPFALPERARSSTVTRFRRSRAARRGRLSERRGLRSRGRQGFLQTLVFLLGDFARSVTSVGAGPRLGMRAGVIFGGHQQVLERVNVGLVPFVVRLLEVLVHLDGVERAVFGTESAVHADIHINEVFFRQRDDALRSFRLGHPDALRRADLRADVATGTADVAVLVVINQDRQDAEPLIDRKTFVGVFDSEEAVGVWNPDGRRVRCRV